MFLKLLKVFNLEILFEIFYLEIKIIPLCICVLEIRVVQIIESFVAYFKMLWKKAEFWITIISVEEWPQIKYAFLVYRSFISQLNIEFYQSFFRFVLKKVI